MLELPESYTIAKQINEHLQGKIISYVELLHTPHKYAWINSEQGSVEEHLEGQTIEGASFYGCNGACAPPRISGASPYERATATEATTAKRRRWRTA